MSDFKVGDRVEVIVSEDASVNPHIKEGMRGTIVVIDDNEEANIGVQFEDFIYGHDADGNGSDGFCWFVYEEIIKKIKTKEEEEVEQLSLTIEKAMNRLYEIADSYTLKQSANGIINILQRHAVDRLELNRFKKALGDNNHEDM